MRVYLWGVGAFSILMGSCQPPAKTEGVGGAPTSGGQSMSGGSSGSTSNGGTSEFTGGVSGSLPTPEPRYHPPSGFENCKHAEVKADCKEGWCKIPSSCFVMGSPEDEWHRGRDTENLTAVTLTHHIEIQQKELTRVEWEQITKDSAPGPENCSNPMCPVAMVSWWDAVTAADMLSKQMELSPCYEPVGCTGSLGKDLVCTSVKDPEKSVYECEGYRLPTRAEAEYAARAGTISTFYSGDITVYEDDTKCNADPALDLIAWYCWNSGYRAHVGGELQPNGFGLYDLVGNLLEWGSEELSFMSSPGGTNPRGQVGSRNQRIFFAGQYDGDSWTARPAGLLGGSWDARGNQGGFRLVRTLDP